MKHFIGGAAVGFLVALWRIEPPKKPTAMSNYEFTLFMAAHVCVATLIGIAAWGLLP